MRILRVSKSEYYDYVKRRKSNAQIEREALEASSPRGSIFTRAATGTAESTASSGATHRRQRETSARRHAQAGAAGEGGEQEAQTREGGRDGRPAREPRGQSVDVEARNKLWVGDITYIGTGEGWLYLAAVIDAFHRKVVGWSMSERMTEKLVTDALEQAVGRESPPDDFSLVFHDDQGSQYTSRAFQRCLESHGIAQSMSRPGNPWDNALAESFFKTLKRELVNGKGYKTREEAKQDVFKYIELYYNRQRMHSSIGYNAPCDLERDVA